MRRNSLYNFPSVKNNKYYNAMIVDENNKLVIGTILNEKHVKDLRKGFKNYNFGNIVKHIKITFNN